MADRPNLSPPLLHVVMDDGSEHEVQALNPDLIRWDMTRSKHGWQDAGAAPMLWLTFVAWAAMRREHLIPDDLTWDLFSTERCLSVSPDVSQSDVGSPTPPGPEPG